MAVYGYCRVSTVQQVEQGDSLETQQVRIQQWTALQGLGVVEEFFIEKAVSGSKRLNERPEGGRLLDKLERGDVIVACRLDRVFRSSLNALEVIETLKEKGIHLHLIDLGGDVTGEGLSKLFVVILSAVAEQERMNTIERIRSVKSQQRSIGKFLGGNRRFGYQIDPDGFEVEDEKEQVVIREIVEKRNTGFTYDRLVDHVTQFGVHLSKAGVYKVYNRHKQDQLAV